MNEAAITWPATTNIRRLAFVLTVDLYASLTLTICPTPLPYFLEFRTFWQELDLSENFIGHLPARGFEGTKVRHLKVNRNYVRSIAALAFLGIDGLRTLDLSHNYLTDLADGIFAPLADIETLRLRYNQLSRVEPGAFKAIPHLEELDLQGNDFEVVPTEAIAAIRRLKRLNLRNNRLHSIHPFAFRGLSLEQLDLGDNVPPLVVHRDAFCGLEPRVVGTEPGAVDWSGLNTLLLDHNGLTGVNPCITRMIWTLELVDVSGNPLDCACDVLALREFASRAVFPGAQCAAPPKMAGRYLSEFDHRTYKVACHAYNRTDRLCWQSCFASPSPLGYSGSMPSIHRHLHVARVTLASVVWHAVTSRPHIPDTRLVLLLWVLISAYMYN